MGWSFLLSTPGDGPVADRRSGTMVRFSPDLVPALWFGLFEEGDELDVLALVGDEPRPISPARWRSTRSWEWSLAGWRPSAEDRTTETTLTPLA